MQTILITGSNRSGTTWLSKMLGLSGKFVPVFEPFNHLIHRSTFFGGAPFTDQYHYILKEERPKVKSYVNRCILYAVLTDRSTFGEGVKNQQFLEKISRTYRGLANLTHLLLNGKRILIKDPIALLSADWLAEAYAAKVIVLIRHPAAYVSSIKRLNWEMSLTSFSDQPEFMATLPERFAEEITEQVKRRPSGNGYHLEDAALSWKVFHFVIHRYQERHPEWLFIKHEDLCNNYTDCLEQLYHQLSLPLTEKIKNEMQRYCHRQNPADPGADIHVLKRDSRAIPQQWKQKITPDEVKRIREITSDIADLFYDDRSWD